jgi:hypothetical protein
MILDTFYLLFKANSEQAVKDVDALDKKVDNLRQTGKKQSEQQQKDTKETTKQHKDLNDILKDTGYHYTKIGEGLAQVAISALSVGAVLKGIFQTSDINSNIAVQSTLIGKSATELKAYGAAAKAAGGDSAAFQAEIGAQFQRFASLGLDTPSIEAVLRKERAYLKQAGTDPARREQAFQNLNISETGHKLLTILSDEEFEKQIALTKKLSDNMEEGAKTAREFSQSWSGVETALEGVFTALGNNLLPILTVLNKATVEILNHFKNTNLLQANPATNLGYTLYEIAKAKLGGGAQPKSGSLSRRDQDLAFWQSQGYTKEQAAAWVAASQRESNGNPNAIGDNGQARGLFQWHPDRQAAILKGTGIDVRTASYDEQLKAAAWEAEQRGDAARIKATHNAAEAAAIHTQYFERPADITGESIRRGQSALNIAQSMPVSQSGGSKTISVKIGDVHVHSAAADATGIATDTASEMERQINIAINNMDDGVKY